ncbi:hypothetical protein QYF61_014517 [Mycteria americana]|uniref:Uncharacterized protein n=1 Tax=Mycteria americana TaxID=33587 RepID=A0AAN7PJR3_MYCAM|nr:hypothetical protein QYF61_014517 [Mycteria americana]
MVGAGAWGLAQQGKAEGARLVQPGEETALGGTSQHPPAPRRKALRRWSQALQRRTGVSCTRRGPGWIRNYFLTTRTDKRWNRLPIEVVQALSLEVFKTQLDKALINLSHKQQKNKKNTEGLQGGKQPRIGTKWARQGQRNGEEPHYY